MIEPTYDVVGVATDGRSLLEKARALNPDVILLDIVMPLLNGLDAARQTKQMMPKVKVIFLTMNLDYDVAAEALSIGASGYLLKSSEGSELLEAIQEALRGGKYVTPSISREIDNAFARDPEAITRNKRLTGRQREVLQLIAEGYSMTQVAMILNITTRTVAFHKYRMMEELGIFNNAELIRYAMDQNLVSIAPSARLVA
jgi:DNA-binding NarL/FixJ family response regulator